MSLRGGARLSSQHMPKALHTTASVLASGRSTRAGLLPKGKARKTKQQHRSRAEGRGMQLRMG